MNLISINKLFRRWLLLFITLRTVVDSNSVSKLSDDVSVTVREAAYMGRISTPNHRMDLADDTQRYRNRRRQNVEVGGPMQHRPRFPTAFNRKIQKFPSYGKSDLDYNRPNNRFHSMAVGREVRLPGEDSSIFKSVRFTKVHVTNFMGKETSPTVSLEDKSAPHVDKTTVDDTLNPTLTTVSINGENCSTLPVENSDLGNETLTDTTIIDADIVTSAFTIVDRVLTNFNLTSIEVNGPSSGEINVGKIHSITTAITNATLVIGNVVGSPKMVMSTKGPDTNGTYTSLITPKVIISSVTTTKKSVVDGIFVNKTADNTTNTNFKLISIETGNSTNLYRTLSTVTIHHVNVIDATESTVIHILINKTDEETSDNITVYNVTISNVSISNENVVDGIITKIYLGNKTFVYVKVRNLVKGNATVIDGTIPNVTITEITLRNGTEITSGKIVDQFLWNETDKATFENIIESNFTSNNDNRSYGNVTDAVLSTVTAGNKTCHNINVAGNATVINGIYPNVSNHSVIHLNGTDVTRGANVTRNTSRSTDNKTMTNLTIYRVKITNLKIDKGRMTNGVIPNVTIGKNTFKNLKITNANIHTAMMVDGTIYNATIINATITNGTSITSGKIIMATNQNTTSSNQSRWNTTKSSATTVNKKLVKGVTLKNIIGNNTRFNASKTKVTTKIRKFSNGNVTNAKLWNYNNSTVDKNGGLFVNMIWPGTTSKPNVVGSSASPDMSMDFYLNSTDGPFASDVIADSTNSTILVATTPSMTPTTASTSSRTTQFEHINRVGRNHRMNDH